MFEDRAKRFAEITLRRTRVFDEHEFLNRLNDELHLFRKNKDKINHLRNIELEITKLKDDHEKGCSKEADTCQQTRSLRKCLFFINQELGEIVDDNLDESYFTGQEKTFDNNEIKDLNKKIDIALGRLEQLGYGQEIIYNEIEELKESLKRITRKDFKLLLLAKLFAFGGKRLLGEKSIQDLFTSAGELFEKMLIE